jgi:hypothetical protein
VLGMKILERVKARRRRKAHERDLAERERQRQLSGQDAQEAIRDVTRGSASAQQGMYGPN